MTASHPLAPELPASASSATDCEVLLDAVTARLRLIASEPPPVPAAIPPSYSTLAGLRAEVLECALALDQIRQLITDKLLAAAAPVRASAL